MLDLRDRILRCGRQMQRAQLLLDPLACVAIHAKSGHLPNGASLAGQSCVPTHPFDCGPEMCKRPGSFMRQRGSPPQRIVDPGNQQLRNHSFVATPRLGEIRSEEHTSELQSLMRISYAVFCLKKK